MTKHLTKIFILKLLCFQIGCILFAFLGCISLGHSLLYENYYNKIYKNIQICDIDLSGKNREQAETIITNMIINPILDEKVLLVNGDSSLQVSVHNFYASTNLTNTIDSVINYSNHLSLLERWNLMRNKQTQNFDIEMYFNESSLTQTAYNFISNLEAEPENARIFIDSDGSINTTNSIIGQSIDKSKLSADISSFIGNLAFSRPNIKTVASLNSNMTLDLTHVIKITPPAVTTTALQQVNSLVASYSTTFNPSSSKAININLAASTINHTLLMPGDTFSFNELVGYTTLEKGYVYAPVIANSKIVEGVGGGICQVSSTLYNAVLVLGLTPIERQHHSKPSTYVPLGLDATIDWQNIDFKFKNTLDFPIYISSFTEGEKLYVNLYSNDSLLDTTYKLVSRVISILPHRTEYIRDTSLPSGTTKLVSFGSDGYKVEVLRHTYRNNLLTDTTTISLDVYNPTSTIYRIGK